MLGVGVTFFPKTMSSPYEPTKKPLQDVIGRSFLSLCWDQPTDLWPKLVRWNSKCWRPGHFGSQALALFQRCGSHLWGWLDEASTGGSSNQGTRQISGTVWMEDCLDGLGGARGTWVVSRGFNGGEIQQPHLKPGWWFKYILFHPDPWGNDPIWLL